VRPSYTLFPFPLPPLVVESTQTLTAVGAVAGGTADVAIIAGGTANVAIIAGGTANVAIIAGGTANVAIIAGAARLGGVTAEVARNVIVVLVAAPTGAAAHTTDFYHKHDEEATRGDRHEDEAFNQVVAPTLQRHHLQSGTLAQTVDEDVGADADDHDATCEREEGENEGHHTECNAAARVDPTRCKHARETTDASAGHRQRSHGEEVLPLRIAGVFVRVDACDLRGGGRHQGRLRVPVEDRLLHRHVERRHLGRSVHRKENRTGGTRRQQHQDDEHKHTVNARHFLCVCIYGALFLHDCPGLCAFFFRGEGAGCVLQNEIQPRWQNKTENNNNK
jgi:hypothetical protein